MNLRSILLFVVLAIPAIRSFSQPNPLTSYANFKLENGNVIWQNVYDVAGAGVDSIKSIIYSYVKSGGEYTIIHEYSDEDEMVVQMDNKIFEKNGDLLSGRLVFEVKTERYRVTLSEVIRFFGVKTKNRAAAFGVSSNVNNMNVGIRFEDDYLNRKGNKLIGMRGLDFYNALFLPEFSIQPKAERKKKDDW